MKTGLDARRSTHTNNITRRLYIVAGQGWWDGREGEEGVGAAGQRSDTHIGQAQKHENKHCFGQRFLTKW